MARTLLDCLRGGVAHLAVAVGFEVVGVEGDALLLVGLQAQDLDGDVFEGVEHLTVVGGEDLGVGAAELDVEGALRVIALPGGGSPLASRRLKRRLEP